MVAARIAETILRDEHAVIPIGSYNPQYGVTISIPNVLVRTTGIPAQRGHTAERGVANQAVTQEERRKRQDRGCQSMILHAIPLPKRAQPNRHLIKITLEVKPQLSFDT